MNDLLVRSDTNGPGTTVIFTVTNLLAVPLTDTDLIKALKYYIQQLT